MLSTKNNVKIQKKNKITYKTNINSLNKRTKRS